MDEVPRDGERYYESTYLVDFRSGAQITAVEYAQWAFEQLATDWETDRYLVWYDIGHLPDEGDEVSIRTCVYNSGSDDEQGMVEFFIIREGSDQEVKIGQGSYSVEPLHHQYVYMEWRTEGGNYK